MKIWKEFRAIEQARPIYMKRKCWSTCYLCKKKWKDTATSFLNMINHFGVYYICDQCVEDHEEQKND